MRHPTDGTLRRLLDEPAGVADADREHVAGCPACLSGLAAAKADAAATGAALRTEVSPDVDAGWRRLTGSIAAHPPGPAAERPRAPRWGTARWRAALRSPAIAGLAVVAVLTGASAAAAANWLPIFRTERVAPITINQADLVKLPDLSAYGEITPTGEPNIRSVPDAAAAEQATGLTLPPVRDLPRGVTGEPTYQIGDQVSVDFTFSVEKATRAAQAAGEALPPPPAGLDGATFRLTAGPGVAAIWSQSRGVPAMVVARGVAPTAYSSGVPFTTARDYLLSLPGLPENLAAQLRTFSGDGTLPLPVATEYLTSSTADVGGAQATVLTSRDGALAGVVWVRDGVLTAVAGSLSADEALAVARGLGRR
nr:hypothetical protein [Micromonospora sp. DSM 115978]